MDIENLFTDKIKCEIKSAKADLVEKIAKIEALKESKSEIEINLRNSKEQLKAYNTLLSSVKNRIEEMDSLNKQKDLTIKKLLYKLKTIKHINDYEKFKHELNKQEEEIKKKLTEHQEIRCKISELTKDVHIT